MKYLCYDSALNEEYTLLELMKRYPEHVSLFAGTDDAGIWDAAPWLFTLKDNFYELQDQMLIQLERCVIFETNDAVKDVCDFLHSKMYRTVNNKQQYFRIWDAAILLKYLSECDQVDRQSFFQVFDAVYTEANSTELYQWSLQGSSKLINVLVNKVEALPVVQEELLDDDDDDDDDKINPGATVVKEDNATANAEPEPDEAKEVPPVADENLKRRRFFLD